MAEINKNNLKLVCRLVEAGITDEKDIPNLRIRDVLAIPNLTRAEMQAICELQESGKSISILSFLAASEHKSEKPANGVMGGDRDEA